MQWEPRGVLVRYFGPFTPAEALGSTERISGHERMGSLHYVLLDFRGVGRCELGPDGAQALDSAVAIAIGAAHTNPDFVIGVVIPLLADRATFREVMAALPYRHEFFVSEQDARDWIRRAHL